MKSFNNYLDELELKHGVFPQEHSIKVQITVSDLYHNYLKDVVEQDSRSLKWHYNQALKMYIQQLSDKK